MENYIVSARKYRPATFHSVIGQNALTTTLKNAIRNNKPAHAYLFCGPRGVGKTTCARIFAKTLNCLNPTPDGEACNVCEMCRTFNEQRTFNVHELDAASNNSVDDIRSLMEQVRIPPQQGKYKVYIIDEVHMLSQAAFNAFLKTLEEPPRHAIFILATTEKHKLLPTILSRCQIYDFNRISVNAIVDYLVYVSEQEKVTFEKEALNVIAQKAEGGMRDALSIFDQCVAYTGGNLTYQSIVENLNVLDCDYYFKLTEAFRRHDVSACLLILNEILNKGFDGQYFVEGLASFFRDLLVCKDPETIVLYEVGEVLKAKYLEVAATCDTAFLYTAIEWSNDCDLAYKGSKNKRLLMEILLIRICQLGAPRQEVSAPDKTINPLTPPSQQPVQSAPAQPLRQEPTKTDKPTKNDPPVVSVSLKDLRNQTKEKVETALKPDASQLPREAFTQNSLTEKWLKYAEGLKEKLHLKNTMLNSLPILDEKENRFTVSVYNPEQQQKLQEESSALLSFLRVELNNAFIAMEVKITEENKKAYTNIEKYQQMVSANPDLQLLVDVFSLRLD